MSGTGETIADRLQNRFDALTRAEKQLAHAILENYPVSGLGTITTVAQNAAVSTPTVARMVRKLGFTGFPDFRARLQRELEAKISGPIAKHNTWAGNAPDGHILNSFTDAVIDNIRQSLAHVEPASFDECCALLADTSRALYVAGGRITKALADYLFLHMQMIRKNVTHIPSGANAWPHYMLDVGRGDVFAVFDVRRYENGTLKMAEMAAARGARIILFTDQWRSPVHKYADHSFSTRIVVPSAWDTSVPALLLLETMIAEVQQRAWPKTRARVEALEDMFDRTKFFRKFT